MRNNTKAWLVITGLLAAAPVSAKTPRIKRVVVFADRAEVIRVQDLSCSGGRGDVEFGDLPQGVDTRTLRGLASGKASVIGVTSRMAPRAEDRGDEASTLKQERLAKGDAVQALVNERTGLNEREQTLKGYETYLRTIVIEEMRSAKPDPKPWQQALDVLKEQRMKLSARQGEADSKLRTLRRELAVLERRLGELGAAVAEDALLAGVAVECNGEASVEVGLAYVVPGATWSPDYDLRFASQGDRKTGGGRAEITMAAVVRQATGEDWEGVQLVLSTAKPRLGAEAPLPAPLYISGYETPKGKVLVQATEQRESLSALDAAPASGPEAAELNDQGQSFALTIPFPVTIHADGRPYWMPVDKRETSAEAKLITVPKLRSYAYQVAVLKNAASYPLLAGTLHTYRHGAYVGDSTLEYKAPGEPVEASLGVDEELKVTRAPIEEQNKAGGFIADQKLNRAYRITVTNQATSTQTIEVRENIPVTKVDDVKVEILKEGTTAGYKLDAYRGLVSWELKLMPGEKKSVDLWFKIALPSDWVVGG